MSRRVVRDLGTLLGVIVILAGYVVMKDFFVRGGLTEEMNKQRVKEETKQSEKGFPITDWELLRKTKGTRAKGPTFAKEVLEMRDKKVCLVGFMTPLYEFRGVKEFILLPLPIQCYFCQSPPMREVVLVQMAENKTTNIVNDPVMFTGKMTLNEGPGTKFFYVLKEAVAGTDMTMMKTKDMGMDHMVESEAQRKKDKEEQEQLLPGHEAPKPGAGAPPSVPAVPVPAPQPAPASATEAPK